MGGLVGVREVVGGGVRLGVDGMQWDGVAFRGGQGGTWWADISPFELGWDGVACLGKGGRQG